MLDEALNKCAENNNYTIYTKYVQGTAYPDAVL